MQCSIKAWFESYLCIQCCKPESNQTRIIAKNKSARETCNPLEKRAVMRMTVQIRAHFYICIFVYWFLFVHWFLYLYIGLSINDNTIFLYVFYLRDNIGTTLIWNNYTNIISIYNIQHLQHTTSYHHISI